MAGHKKFRPHSSCESYISADYTIENTAKPVISWRQEFVLALFSENILWKELQQPRDFASSKL